MNVRAVVIGLVIGLVFGAGVTSLVWALVTDTGNDDVAAVCGIIERTPTPTEDTSMDELRRWAVSEVMPSVAKEHPEYRPLADALDKVAMSLRQLDSDSLRDAVNRAKGLCADV
ncbi:MAG: hypothetical protein M3422_03320 [Actinomycetota bacterium]|nr:hypothetical protein [Actinomycetota bacterium]